LRPATKFGIIIIVTRPDEVAIITVKLLLAFERTSRVALKHGIFPRSLQAIHWIPAAEYCQCRGEKQMFKVGRTLILAAGFTAFAFIPAAMMLAPTALAQTMGEYGATVGSNASSAGTLGSSIGPENSVGSSIGSGAGNGGLNMGVGGGNLHSDVVNGQGPPRTIIIGGDDTSNYAHSPTREDDEDDASGDDWTEVK
jgi:hypothetical protein